MEITLSRKDLLNAIAPAQGVVNRKGSVPILSHLLLEPTADRLSIKATDLEIGLSNSASCTAREPRPLTLNAHKLFQLVRESIDDNLSIKTLDGDWIELRCGRSRFKMMTLDPRSFPAMPHSTDKGAGKLYANLSMKSALLREIFEATIFVVSTDEARYNLSGVYVEAPDAGKIRCVATDGHRLALIEREAAGFSLPHGMILPRKGIALLQNILADHPEADVSLGFYENCVMLDLGSLQVSMRLVEGEFPDYRGVLPRDFKHETEVPREQWIAAIKRVAIFATDRTHGVKLALGEEMLTVTSTSPESGEAEDSLEIPRQTGRKLEIGFNGQYLLQALAVLPKEMPVTLHLIDETGPGMITSAADPEFRYVLMPMRL